MFLRIKNVLRRDGAEAKPATTGGNRIEAARRLGISERTAVLHINNAMHKLECVNKHQAVLKALPFADKEDFELATRGLIDKPDTLTIKDAKGNVCCGHLKRWYYYPKEIESLVGKNAEVYRCENCKTIYKPDLGEVPRSYTQRF